MRFRLLSMGWMMTLIALPGPVQAREHSDLDVSPICDNASPTEYIPASSAQPTHLIIHCAFAGDAADRVIVYDRDGDMRESGAWSTSTDFDSDLWVFDAAGDGTPNLVLDFHREAASLVADIYDDQNGDGKVAIDVRNGQSIVSESQYPTISVVARNSWWQKDEKTNFNLDITVDGPVYAAFASELYLDRLQTDGRPDFEITVRDTNQDGRPDYEWINAWPDAPDNMGIYRTELMASVSGLEPPITNFVFWPYLGTSYEPPRGFEGGKLPTVAFERSAGITYGFVKDYGNSFPPIQIWWPGSRIAYVGEFVASRGNESNWFVYSINRFGPGLNPYANFENPFAFYDLAADNDGYPELQIRVEHYGPNDRLFQFGRFAQSIQTVRYSWDQFNRQQWDFKLDLIGRHPIESTVPFPDFAVQTIPYATLPYWVTKQAWDSVEFVAVEKPGYWTTEGIYESLANTQTIRDEFITALTDTASAPDLSGWPVGFRSEYNRALQSQPRLYFSPVDRKLHLLNALAGVWKLDDRRIIQYTNLGGDHVNQWTLFENGEQVKGLYVVSEYAIYADASGVQLLRTDVLPALFTTLPPRNHDEWLQLGADLEKHSPTFAPDDFAAMFQQFDGPRFSVDRASLRDFRLTSDGFRFVLDLQPGFSVNGTVGPDLAGLQPGEYVVTYNGAFTVQPLTLAQPQVVPGSLRLSDPSPIELEPIQIEAILENKGLEDVANLRVQALVNGPGLSSAQVITATEVALLGGQTAPVHFDWTPPAPGEWQIHLAGYVDDPQHTVLSTSDAVALTVDVAHRPALEPQATWEISNVGQPIPLLLLLAGLGLGAAVVVILSLRGAGKSG